MEGHRTVRAALMCGALLCLVLMVYFLVREKEMRVLPAFFHDLFALVGMHLPFFVAALLADRILELEWRYTSQGPTLLMRPAAVFFLAEGTVALLYKISRGRIGEAAASFSENYVRITDAVFYVCFAVIFLFRFYLTTSLPYTNAPYLLSRIAVMFLAAVYAVTLPRIKNLIFIVVSLACLISGYLYHAQDGKYAVYLLLVLTAAAALKSGQTILKIAFFSGLCLMLTVFVLSLSGIIVDYTYVLLNRGAVTQHAFGIIYYTDCSAHWLFLVAMYALIRNNSRNRLRFLDFIPLAAVLALNVFLIRGRANLVGLFLLVMIMFVHQIVVNRREKRAVKGLPAKETPTALRVVMAPFIAIYPFFFALSAYVVQYYRTHRRHIPLQKLIRKFTSVRTLRYRCRYTSKALKKYPITLFGNNVKERGVAGYSSMNKKTFYIDNSYFRMLIICGVVFLILFLLLTIVIQTRAYRSRLFHWMLVLSVVAMIGLVEHHLIDPGYNIFPLLAFSLWPDGQKEDRTSQSCRCSS